MKKRLPDLISIGLALSAVLASLWVAEAVFERLPHLEDEFAYLWEAEVMADGRIWLPSPAEPQSFLVPFVVDYQGQRFGKYPPGWPAALSIGARAGIPWAVNALLAGLVIWLIYRLGSKLMSKGVGALAALLALSSPTFLILAGSLMSHLFSLFLTLVFVHAWIDLFLEGSVPSQGSGVPNKLLLATAGLSMGLLGLTRPLTAAGVALPFALHGVLLLLKGKREVRKQLLVLSALAIFVAGLLLIWRIALTGDATLNAYSLWWEYDRLGFGRGIGVTESGHNLSWAYWNARHSLRVGLHDLFGWPYLSILFLPFGLWAVRKRKGNWLLAGIFPALVLVYGFYWVGSWLYGPRYYFEALPGLALLSAAGVVWLGGWWGKRGAKLRRVIIGSLLILLLGLNVRYYLPPRFAMVHALNNITRERHHPFKKADFDRALIFVHPAHSWTEYGTLLTLTPPFSDEDLILVYGRGKEIDESVADQFPGWPVYHYYPDEPYVFYRLAR